MLLNSIHTYFYNNNVFSSICKIGNLEQLQQIIQYHDKQQITNNSDLHNYAFTILCQYGHLHIRR